ncbi:5'-3' exonuclease [Ureaplasma ceti]|uniref:5'-3' exonuclease n=1 Tax=Ureaplasma ceti TaxID=3119530 RepID=A0ABP9U7D6_9BACT
MKAVVIDGNSLTYRMFYATYNLAVYATEHNLYPVNALKLMMETCFKIKESGNYDYCLVAFDYGKKTFRHETFSDYKAGRKAMPQELVQQMPLIQEALQLMGFNVIKQEGIEADDFIGSFSKLMSENHVQVDVYSSDKDMLQLVNAFTSVYLIKSGLKDIQIHTLANFAELNYGLRPNQVPDFKGVVGDSSDNLAGVKGIGIKTGIKLLLKYDSLENIYNNLSELTVTNQKKFNESKEMALMCKQLATIDCQQLTDLSVRDFEFKKVNNAALLQMMDQYKINGLKKYLKEEQAQIDLFGF